MLITSIWLAEHQKALNLGIKDEIAALQWVQHNIGAFGGDKDKVGWSSSPHTLFQSSTLGDSLRGECRSYDVCDTLPQYTS
jgi:hypothetical protein